MRIAIEKCDKARRRMVKRMVKRRQKRMIKRRTKSRKKEGIGEKDEGRKRYDTPPRSAFTTSSRLLPAISLLSNTTCITFNHIRALEMAVDYINHQKNKPSHPLITTPAHSTPLSGFSSDYSAYGETRSLSP
jgi:hypothetical protein